MKKLLLFIITSITLYACEESISDHGNMSLMSPDSEEILQKLDLEDPWRLYEKPFGEITSLNGTWKVTNGSVEDIPAHFIASVQVPGLVSMAEPAFVDVGMSGKYEAFWYQNTFTLKENSPKNTFLKVYKAKYGTRVFINGKEAGLNNLNFTPSQFEITSLVKPVGEVNEIIIRVGAHIDALPDTVTTGGEVEKHRYMPGIYDNVELIQTNDVVIQDVQVMPDIINGIAIVQLSLNNLGERTRKQYYGEVIEYSGGRTAGKSEKISIEVEPGINHINSFSIPLSDTQLWTPEDPFLYVLKLSDGELTYQTRFGMRSFRLDSTRTNLALLNENPYYFRGTNVALFRFFEDPECGDLPWDRTWVRKLFRKYKSLGLNSLRTCISSYPKFWYELADEEGLALFAEYPIWYALKEGVSHADFDKERKDPIRRYGIYPKELTTPRLVNEYTHWMRDLWNHASVIAWDAQNETWSPHTGEAINIVRSLDLSDRPWDNGWSPPASKSDWREGHTYFARYNVGSEAKNALTHVNKPFSLRDLKIKEKIPKTFYLPYQYAYDLPLDDYTEQPCLLNEYGYLWLNRDGSPTWLTKPYYDAVLGPDCDPDTRKEHYAYMLAAITEYWRSARTCFGINYPFGLAHSVPYGATSDNLSDVREVAFDPYFEKYMTSAFSPVAVCIEEWEDQFSVGSFIDLPIMITNDLDTCVSGNLSISLIIDNKAVFRRELSVSVPAWEQKRTYIRVNFKKEPGEYSIMAQLIYSQNEVRSIRKIRTIK